MQLDVSVSLFKGHGHTVYIINTIVKNYSY